MVRLTTPQRELLQEISECPRAVTTTYKPAQKLVADGLATWTCFGLSDVLHITPAGRTAIGGENG